MIVLYSDSNIMAIVICGSFLKDDTCEPETQDFFVLSRRRAQVEVSEDLKYNMTVLAAEACIAADSLRELSEGAVLCCCQKILKINEKIQN